MYVMWESMEKKWNSYGWWLDCIGMSVIRRGVLFMVVGYYNGGHFEIKG